MTLLNQYRGLRKETYILFLGTVVTNLGAMIWPVLTMVLNQKLHMDASTISVYIMIMGLAGIPVQILGGKLADRCNKKMLIVYVDIISIICFITCACIELSISSIILYGIASLMQNIEYPSYEALLADITPAKDRKRAFSLMYFGINLGSMLAPVLGGLLFEHYLWLAFLINGLSILVSTILIYFKVENIEKVKEKKKTAYEKACVSDSLFTVLKQNKVLMVYLLSYAIMATVYNQYNFLMPLDLCRVHGEKGALLYGSLASMNCVVALLFTTPITKYFAKTRDAVKMTIGDSFIILGYLIFCCFVDETYAVYIAMTLFTIGEIFCVLSNGPYLTNRTPQSHRGRIFGFSTVLFSLFYAIGNLCLGKIYDFFGPEYAWMYVLGFAFFAFLLNAMLIVVDKKAYPDIPENKVVMKKHRTV